MKLDDLADDVRAEGRASSDGRRRAGAGFVVAKAVDAVALARGGGRAVGSHAHAGGAAFEVRATLGASGARFWLAMMRSAAHFGGSAMGVGGATGHAHAPAAVSRRG